MLLRSPGPISPDTYSGHIRRRALCPNRLRNGMSQRSSSSCQSDILPTMVGPSKSRPPMSHRKTDLGIPCRSKSARVVLRGRHEGAEVALHRFMAPFAQRRLAWVKGTRRDLIRSHSSAINKTIVRLLATFDRHKTSFHNASGRGTRRADAEQGRL